MTGRTTALGGGEAATVGRSAAWLEVGVFVGDEGVSRRSGYVGEAVTITAAAVLAALGRVAAAAGLLAVLAAINVAGLLAPAVHHATARLIRATGRVVGRGLSWLSFGALTILVVTPVWVIARLGRWDMLRPTTAPSGRWQRLQGRLWDRVPTRPYAKEPRSPWARRAYGVALVAVPASVLLAIAVPLRDVVGRSTSPVDIGGLSAGQPDADGTVSADGEWVVTGQAPSRDGDPLLAEREAWAAEALATHIEIGVYDPNLIIRNRDISTPYLNLHDRVRRSYTPNLGEGALDVWFFGSSALFGPNLIRDGHTIVSEVVRQAAADGIAVKASNFAVSGYETWQEVMLLGQMLTERPDPDLVVFYGGYNDLRNYVQPGAPTQVSSAWAGDVADALGEAGASVLPPDDDTVPTTRAWSPGNAATIYDRGIELAGDILAARGIPFHNVLQPSLWTRDRSEDVATLEGVGADRAYHESFGEVYDAARAAITADVVDLSDSLDELPGVVYWDEVHHNEAANAVVARAAYAELQGDLDRLWRRNDPT